MLGNFGGDPPENMLAGSDTLLADDANDTELGGLEDLLFPEKFQGLGLQGGGLFEVPGLLEDESLQLRCVSFPEVVQPEVARDGQLALRDRLLAFTVEPDQVCMNSQLCGAETHQFVEDLEWPLLRETIEQTHESDLIGEAEAIVGATALGDLLQVFTV